MAAEATFASAENGSQRFETARLEDEANRIQLAEVLPFLPINGDTLRVERVDAPNFGADPKFDTVGIAPGEGVAVPQSSLEAKFELKMIVQDLLIQDFTAFCQSNVNSQVGVQLEAATRRLLYVFWQKFGTGNEGRACPKIS